MCSGEYDMQIKLPKHGALVAGGGAAPLVTNPLTGETVANFAEATPDLSGAATVAMHETSEI